jgi:HK97 family phage major capsid protein/HK97 family phage prohead protease
MKKIEIMTRAAADGNTSKIVTRMKEIKDRGGLRREATLSDIDAQARTCRLAFSSEAEYERWFGVEVLDHTAGSVRMERLQNKAALLWMHDLDDQRGVVESASIDSDRIGRAVVRFSKSAAGEQLFQDVIDGIITKVSVGYLVHGLKLLEERENMDVYLVNDWEPVEISMVSVPADDDVGVGRALENPQVERSKETPETSHSGQINLTGTKETMEKILRDGAGNLVRANVDADGNIVKVLEIIERAGDDVLGASARGAETERSRVRAIAELGKTYSNAALANEFIGGGKSPEEFQRALLANFQTERSAKPLAEQERSADIGMTDKEVRQFSIMRAIRTMADPANKQFREDAAFEIEASQAAATRYGKNPKGIIIPSDVLSRSFTTSGVTGGTGSALIATELLSGSFIELLRKRAWVMRRARTLGGLVGNVDIPRQNAAGSAYWVGEGTAPTGGQPGVDQIQLTPKTVGATTDITRRLMMQATPDAEALVRDDLLKIVALEIDRVALYGTGSSNMPKGLTNYTGINAVAFGVAGAPTFAEFVAMETAIASANADVDGMSYAFNAAIRGYAKTKVKFPSAGSATIWEAGGTINGYATDVSNQVATNDTFFGNWQDMVIAMWGGLELTVDPYALSTSGGLRLVALQDIDINLRHLESFCVGR